MPIVRKLTVSGVGGVAQYDQASPPTRVPGKSLYTAKVYRGEAETIVYSRYPDGPFSFHIPQEPQS